MSKVGKAIERVAKFPIDLITGGNPNIDPGQAQEDTAQKEADKAQGTANAAIARRRKRSLLGSGMNNGISSGVAQQAKKLLGE